MNKNSVIVVTGAAGFIGSYFTGYLNRKGYENLLLVDEFDDETKELNLLGKKWMARVERDNLIDWLSTERPDVDFFFHLGARTDTTEFDYSIHEKLNVEYSKDVWNYCTYHTIPLIYASSAATYGAGELGYKDDHDMVEKLRPLNPYGVSKNEFDKWAILQSQKSKAKSQNTALTIDDSRFTPDRQSASGSGTSDSRLTTHDSRLQNPPFWAGLKFFNVYGPNEYHKDRMASVVFHAFKQIQATGKVKLFRSHRPDFKDGEQLRDFIYVEDVAKVMFWMMQQFGNQKTDVRRQTSDHRAPTSGIYNLGTGKARTFNDLVCAIYQSLGLHSQIEYIDTPQDIRENYQYFTEADMTKLSSAGFKELFYSLEKGVEDYVQKFLSERKYY